MSFVESGVLESKAESESIYLRVMAISMVALAIVGPAFGYISDKTDSRVLIPVSFLLRAICAISFRFVEDPSEWPAMMLCVAISVISTI
jgi:MFS-type transporter involved in bile tolerance (Atg22 family)